MCIVAIDYDGTITADYEKARLAIEELKKRGHFIVIWSSRNNVLQHKELQKKVFQDMVDNLKKYSISYDDLDIGNCGKYHAQVYIDDKCWRFENNWEEILRRIY